MWRKDEVSNQSEQTNKQTNNLEARIQIESMGASTGSGKGVLAHAFLEEVRLALKGNQIHPREGVLDRVELGLTEASQ